MSLELRIAGVLLTNRVRMTNGGLVGGVTGLPSSAWYGEAMTAGLDIDDPDGDMVISGWQTFTADETLCTTKPRIFTGWITARRQSRGPYKQGAGRVISCDIIDSNALFSFEPFRASSAKRPEESDNERMAFMQASAPMSHTPAADNGRFNTTDNPINFGPADYVTQYPASLAGSVAGISGKNFYTYWDNDADEISIHYDVIAAGPSSTLAISNVESEEDSTTFFPTVEAELTVDPSGFYNAILLGYLGGNYVYAENDPLIDAMSPTEFSPSEFIRTEVYTTDRIGKATTASSIANSMLQARATEQQTVTCRIRLPAAQVNLVEAGDIISAHFTHLDGFTDAVEVPVIRRNVIPAPGRRDLYDVDLELSAAVSYAGPGGGGEPGPFEPIPCDIDDVVLVQSNHAACTSPGSGIINGPAWPAPTTAGNVLVAMWSEHGSASGVGSMAGWTAIATDVAQTGIGGHASAESMFWKIADGGDATPQLTGNAWAGGDITESNAYVMEIAGVDVLDTSNFGHSNISVTEPGVLVTPTADRVAFIVTELSYHTTLAGTLTPNAGVVEVYEEGNIGGTPGGNPQRWIAYMKVADTTGGSYDVNGEFAVGNFAKYASITAAFVCSGSGGVPGAGMHVKNEHVADGDGTTTTFTTRFPYTPGSLEVFVDGVPIILGLTEVDPDAGTFTLDFAPQGVIGDTRAEEVTANYQASVGGPGT